MLRAFLAGRVARGEGAVIISGAFGVYRRQDVLDAGGLDTRPSAGTWSCACGCTASCANTKRPYRWYSCRSVCWTEVPSHDPRQPAIAGSAVSQVLGYHRT
jgi:hypothetical protein